MKVFNIGIIGFGGFGKFLFNAWNQLDNVQVTSIADLNAAAITGIENVTFFIDWKDMILSENIDLIAIVTEPSTHQVIANACMRAGKHVLIEKPLAINTSDARAIIKTRDQTGVVAAIDFIMRFNPLLQTIRSLNQAGVFGKLRRVDVENYAQDEQLPPEHWFWHHDRSGGILIEHAVHFIDLVHFLSPSKHLTVNGLKHNRNALQEDQIMANVLYESGLIATHYHSFARPGFFETTDIKLSYDIADIQLHGWIPLSAEVKVLVNEQSKEKLLSNPFFECLHAELVASATDESRPAGWGISDTNTAKDKQFVRSGGVQYEADEMITGRFSLGRSKQEVYADCVKSSLLDVLQKVSDSSHTLMASLESGLSSLEIAELATVSARSNS
ncbi:MAG: Gfo/Idh/MocA family oxidoreductase [Saprospiraceae bacterium]|nr:Gfo/Idh/MocA family oxidoreductase [Saprospiraceae bacterium]